MLIYYYYVATILVLINLLIFIANFEEKKVNALCLLLNLLMLVANLGYLAKALSTDPGEIHITLKICYIGGCFIPPLLFYTTCCVGNVKIPRLIKVFSYGFSFLVYCFVLTIGISKIYYKSMSISSFMGTTIVSREVTPLYFLFYLVLIGNMIAEFAILLYTYNKKNSISKKTMLIFLIVEGLTILFFFLAKFIDDYVEVMPLLYVIDGWVLIYLHKTVLKYNIEDAISTIMNAQETTGYILFNTNLCFMGANDYIQTIIPEVLSIKLEKKAQGIPLFDNFYEWIEKFESDKQNDFSFGNEERHFQITIYYKTHRKKNIGFIVQIKEDTDKYKYMQLLQIHKTDLENQVQEKTEHILNIQEKLVLGMASMVENRDGNTGGHIRRTSEVVNILLNTIVQNNMLKLKKEFVEDMIRAAPMHDLGKIAIDDKILRKPGRLTEEEYAIMKTHATKSSELVQELLKDIEKEQFVTLANNVARHHHERWDGNGYPDKLKGEEIPLEARIMAVADVYDALVSKRCYKEAMSFEDAAKIMIESMGSHFDPALKEVFLQSQKRLENYYYYDK